MLLERHVDSLLVVARSKGLDKNKIKRWAVPRNGEAAVTNLGYNIDKAVLNVITGNSIEQILGEILVV